MDLGKILRICSISSIFNRVLLKKPIILMDLDNILGICPKSSFFRRVPLKIGHFDGFGQNSQDLSQILIF